jgi:hypothetical protein
MMELGVETVEFEDEPLIKPKNEVWKFFRRARNGVECAKCITCNKVIKTKAANTSGLRAHHKLHNPSFGTVTVTATSVLTNESSSRNLSGAGNIVTQKRIDGFLKKKSLDDRYSEMAALDGISLNAMAKSENLKQGLAALGHTPYSCATSVCKAIQRVGSQKIEMCKMEIQESKNQGHLFCLSFDEWTSM